MVKNPPANAGDVSLIPDWETEIPHTEGQLNRCTATTELVHPWRKILEQGAIAFSGGSSWPRDLSWVSCIAGRFFTVWAATKWLSEDSSLPPHLLDLMSLALKAQKLPCLDDPYSTLSATRELLQEPLLREALRLWKPLCKWISSQRIDRRWELGQNGGLPIYNKCQGRLDHFSWYVLSPRIIKRFCSLRMD